MQVSDQNLRVLGFDVRNLGKLWLDAWRELLFAWDSPVRRLLDEIVCLRSLEGEWFYQSGEPCTATGAQYTAYLLPDEIVLSKTLELPAAVEVDLAAALALEVDAYSPFAADDTRYGWRIVRRDTAVIEVVLAIVSRSAAAACLGREFDAEDTVHQEIWARAGDEKITLNGFGEAAREGSYRKRLWRIGLMLLGAALLMLVITAVNSGFKGFALQEVRSMAAAAERDSAEAARIRAQLVRNNELVGAVAAIARDYPNPHLEIARLTQLLDDGESVDNFSMDGLAVGLRGRAPDAASVMQRLTQQDNYAEVTAPRAFARVKGAGVEQFYLDIQLRRGDTP